MIAVQVADEYIVEFTPFYAMLLHLHLCAFSAVYQYMLTIYGHYLCRRVAAEGRQR
jgi:hypothetical protein